MMRQNKIIILIAFIFLLLFSVPAAAQDSKEALPGETETFVETAAENSNHAKKLYLSVSLNRAESAFETKFKNIKSHIHDFVGQIAAVWSGLPEMPSRTSAAFQTLSGQKGHGFMAMQFFIFFALIAAGVVVERSFNRLVKNHQHRCRHSMPTCIGTLFSKIFFRFLLDTANLAVFTSFILVVFLIFFPSQGPLYQIVVTYLPAILIIRLIYLLLVFIYSPKEPQMRIAPQDCLSAMIYFFGILAFVAITLLLKKTLYLLQANGLDPNSFLLLYSMIGLIQFAILLAMFWKDKTRINRLMMKSREQLGGETGADTGKSQIVFAVSGVLFLSLFEVLWQINLIVFKKDVTLPLLLTLMSFPFGYLLYSMGQRLLLIAAGKTELMDPRVLNKDILKPGMDLLKMLKLDLPAVIEPEASENSESILEPYLPLLDKLLGMLITFSLLFGILRIWGIELPVGVAVMRSATAIFTITILSYIFWEASRAYIDRKIKEESPDQEENDDGEGGAGGSRKATILTLVRRFVLAGLVLIVVMTTLEAVGVNIGALLAGAGILGIAVGFGSQALVKDILSGMFYLIDDAFRVGDYIETAGVKGTVQQIAMRSAKLRHPRGMLYTIPYGSMGSIQNYSRDYIISKLSIRVRYDANINKIKKIIKQINKIIQKDEELGPIMLDKVKSQGVREMDDSAMIVRVKFKTVPGEQFVVRREVYRLIQEKFRENGIEFAHKNVTVYIPQADEKDKDDPNLKQKLLSAGAAAASAAEEKQMPPGAAPREA